MTPRQAVGWCVLGLVGLFLLLAQVYRSEVPHGCEEQFASSVLCKDVPVDDECRVLCDESSRKFRFRSPGWTNTIFFATQTITTTGYGSQVFIKFSFVQFLASIGAVLGSVLWAGLGAGLYGWLVRGNEEPKKQSGADA